LVITGGVTPFGCGRAFPCGVLAGAVRVLPGVGAFFLFFLTYLEGKPDMLHLIDNELLRFFILERINQLLKWYAHYFMHDRNDTNSQIHRGGRLYQEWMVD
jgi:hypothetical protein